MNTSRRLTRRAALATAGAMVAGAGAVNAADPPPGPLVVELFTSQGCSSCPPADRLLGELAARGDVVALSFHVNYWDRLGWKDPFASQATTARQHGYGRSLAQSSVYTPEMVVNGVVHAPGNSRAGLAQLLVTGGKTNPLRLRPALALAPDSGVTVALPELAGVRDDHDVWLITYDRTHTTEVLRGENRGERLTNRNVVRSIESLARWRGVAQSWTLDAAQVPADRSVAVLVQRCDFGAIIGATSLERGAVG